MAVVLLDTTVLIDLLRGRRGALERLRTLRERGDVPATCATNVEEVHRGLRGDPELAAARALVAGLAVIPLGEPEGSRAGAWRREHAARGLTLTQADCLIAAAAVTAKARLATGNPRDFPMPELTVEHWPVAE
jgi:predicted nucleic acid-binding protein